MGDRGNIVIRQGNEEVWLYTHWGGSELGSIVHEALKKRWRWDDAPYLTRIVFDEMTDGSHGEETGYGIWVSPPDNEHLILVLDVDAQEVQVCAQTSLSSPKRRISFEGVASSKGLPPTLANL